MSRTLKRVPLDFKWPLNEVWKGYRNPHRPFECKQCDGRGYNKETQQLADDWYGWDSHGKERWCHNITQDEVDALLEHDRLWDFTREPINSWQRWVVDQKIVAGGNSWLPFHNGHHPTADEVNAWSRQGFGHDALNRSICVETRAKRLGVYGLCEQCDGEGVWFVDDLHRERYEAYEEFEPPAGDGFQLWETTSEGSPVSPVFESFDELCEWAAQNATTFGSCKTSAVQWKTMLKDDFVYHQEGNNIFM